MKSEGDGRSALPDERSEEVLDALRAYGAISTELTRRFATDLGLHSTDAAALLEIFEAEERGTSLSPARLSERIGLTSGATSSLLNRLEDSGHITRKRGHTDRRIVSLHSSPAIREKANAFFEPLSSQLTQLLATYPTSMLGQVAQFVKELCCIMAGYVEDFDADSARAKNKHLDAP